MDVSCPNITTIECAIQQQQISYAIKSIKGTEADSTRAARSHIGYIEIGSDGTVYAPLIELNDPINITVSSTNQDAIDDLYNTIRNKSDICQASAISQRQGNPNLNGALAQAINQFKIYDSDNQHRDKKIVIFSNCKAQNIEEICLNYENDINNANMDGTNGVNVYQVNNGDAFDENDAYIACLAEFDSDRIFNNPTITDAENYYDILLPSFQEMVCDAPTPTPTTDPSPYPSISPSEEPTDLPTTDSPTTDSPTTDSPTTDSPTTTFPTSNAPTTATPSTGGTRDISACLWGEYYKYDVIILNDISCPNLTPQKCKTQQEQVANFMKSIKGLDEVRNENNNLASDNVGYFEFDGKEVHQLVDIDSMPYNIFPVTQNDLDSYYYSIADRDICDADQILNRTGTPNLVQAVDAAADALKKNGDRQRDSKIVIFSNCKYDDIEEVCDNFERFLFGGTEYPEIYMVNNGDKFDENDDDYIMCLIEYDENRIFTNTDIDDDKFYDEIIPPLQLEICSMPTPAPTEDPTPKPISLVL